METQFTCDSERQRAALRGEVMRENVDVIDTDVVSLVGGLCSRKQEVCRVIDGWLSVVVWCVGGGEDELEGASWVLWLDGAADGEAGALQHCGKPLMLLRCIHGGDDWPNEEVWKRRNIMTPRSWLGSRSVPQFDLSHVFLVGLNASLHLDSTGGAPGPTPHPPPPNPRWGCCRVDSWRTWEQSLTNLPEQVILRAEAEEDDDTHSLSLYPDWTQTEWTHHTGLTDEYRVFPAETAEPQSSSLQTSSVSFKVQSVLTGLQLLRCFTSSVPAQRLGCPTNWTGSGHKENRQLRTSKVSLIRPEVVQVFYLSRWVQQLCQRSRLSLRFYSPAEQTRFLHTRTPGSTVEPPPLHGAPPGGLMETRSRAPYRPPLHPAGQSQLHTLTTTGQTGLT